VLTVFVHRRGRTERASAVDPAWLAPGSDAFVWVDLETPTADEAAVLTDVFHFHELAIEDALAEIHDPKVEPYDNFLYVILHGIDFQASKHRFATRDVDFFLGSTFLVTVHRGSRSVRAVRDACERSPHLIGDGLPSLMHRILDSMVHNYDPEVEKVAKRLDGVEEDALKLNRPNLVRRILDLKRDVSSLRRVTLRQRDVVGRLTRREFPEINEQVAFRFRDVHDQLMRLGDETLGFQDRITGILEAHLSAVSNRLNEVMKVLTIIATIAIPMTVITGLYGMNVVLPDMPGGEGAQFWWILGMMGILAGVMLWFFRRRGWF
jgi:magnesium transporter